MAQISPSEGIDCLPSELIEWRYLGARGSGGRCLLHMPVRVENCRVHRIWITRDPRWSGDIRDQKRGTSARAELDDACLPASTHVIAHEYVPHHVYGYGLGRARRTPTLLRRGARGAG